MCFLNSSPCLTTPRCSQLFAAHIIYHKANMGSTHSTPIKFFYKVASREYQGRIESRPPCSGAGYASEHNNITTKYSKQETLSLFPLEPTGILQAKTTMTSPSISTNPSSSSETTTAIDELGSSDEPFFDFFSGNGFSSSN